LREFTDYVAGQLEGQRAAGADTVALAIADGTVDGRPLTTDEQIGMFVFLIIAGHETTVHGLSAANHDPAVFEEPTEFRCERERNPRLAFGYGVHRCVGEHLALLEMRIVAEEVLSLLPDYRFADGFRPQWSGGRMTRGIESLPVQLR
jgi:cytochrome P450